MEAAPLQGIRIIDWTIWQQGPVATAMLGDLGADVIKVENIAGDPARGMSRIAGLSTKKAAGNFYFDNNNRNKRSITVNLSTDEGKQIIYRLTEKSDVLVHNFREGVAERNGVDYDMLCQYNPKLIYAVASGYGPSGPDSSAPAFDRCGLARSGIMTTLGEPDMPPLMMMGGIADQIGAIILAYAVLSALVARERSGIGQKVEVSQLGSMIHLQSLNLAAALQLGQPLPRRRRAHEGNPLSNHYQCGDGKWISLAMLQADRYWPTLCKALGIEQYQNDDRFKTMDVRSQNCEEIISILDRAFATRDRAAWIRSFKEAGDLIYAPVNDIWDLTSDPQVLENGYITDFDHPASGRTKMVGIPVHLSKTPGSIRIPAPELGQHTEEVLLELGYGWADISSLKDKGVI